MKYRVTAGNTTRDIDIQGDRVLVDGVPHVAVLRAVPGTPLRILELDGTASLLPVEGTGQGQWTIHAAGEAHHLEVLDERTAHIRSLVGSGVAAHGPAQVKAPMPGLVVRILVQPGQAVSEGEGLVVLEAMKMENELKSAGSGTVDRILVSAGQAVEKGALLISFA